MKKKIVQITLSADESSLKGLLPLLQYGVDVTVDAGLTIGSLLTDYYSIDPIYVKQFISTIFLDGKPVDDPSSVTVHGGSTLSLSGAMPGLVGAVLRSGSILGSFRHSITHHGSGAEDGTDRITLTVKLFNRVMRETGAAFLFRGIELASGVLVEHLKEMDNDFWNGISYATVDGKRTDPVDIPETVNAMGEERVLLRVAGTEQDG